MESGEFMECESDNVMNLSSQVVLEVLDDPNQELNRTFYTSEELQRSEWHTYFDRLYGISSMSFPFSMAKLNFLHRSLIPKLLFDKLTIQRQQKSRVDWKNLLPVENSTIRYGQLYRLTSNSHWNAEDLWRCTLPDCVGHDEYTFPGWPSHSRVEVTHHADAMGGWMYHAVGTGVFYDVGRTIKFRKHGNAFRHFLGPDRASHRTVPKRNALYGKDCKWTWASLRQTARRAGFQSIQFLNYVEGIHKFEILDTGEALSGNTHQTTCPLPGSQRRFTSCWAGSQPCHCDKTFPVLNCHGDGSVCRPPFASAKSFRR
eukprot:gnl/TRDRNA2_/TRDRNA2_154001_c2_seq2.p1 gnl/TRDRNA2_/TRDRNA2_154001_c2~~gnl/TRDRNA2_/TRDRNA2_154001_c2_seq2.p1  ORF type:complete len:337 (+),score=2.75 gnl/TRDRNA2_/TRDRNA2_154001_c2_seq2:68-1012(+)